MIDKTKKSQLKIQEMAFMLVALIFFFTLVGLFALSIFYSNMREEARRIAEDRTLSALSSLADSPELSCEISKSNCIDGDRLVAILDKEVYKNFWPFSSLSVVRLHALGLAEKDMITCNKATYPNCDRFIIYDKKVKSERSIGSFVALCRKYYEDGYIYDRCEVAKLIAGTDVGRYENE